MTDCAELELGLNRIAAGRYALRARFWLPGAAAESGLGTGAPIEAAIDREALDLELMNPAKYGRCLADSLFASPAAYAILAEARAAASARNVPLRLRLFFDPSAPELHAVRWETLLDPARQTPLFTDENLLCSRFISSSGMQDFTPQERSRLRALVMIANPSGLADSLAPIDVPGELARAQAGLEGMDLLLLDSGGKATLENLLDLLRDGIDILYLVAHGGYSGQGQPFVLLEKPDGTMRRVNVDEMITRLRELSLGKLPLLTMLVSCTSAGEGDGRSEPLVALGPSLAAAGIPAVIAMQGLVRFDTMQEFLPAFFRELQRDGVIDRALAVARGRVRAQPDWWMPVLFSRLRDNRLLRPSPAAQPLKLQHFEPETVYIPGGPFVMGRDTGDGVPAHETPQHTVDLSAFRIGKNPVTNRQFAEFIRQTNQQVNPEAGWLGQSPPPDRLDHPVSAVTWYQAAAYCAWLSEKTGRRYTLPTEAHWEKAARGTKGWLYPWDEVWEEGRCNPNSAASTPVNQYPPQNAYGVCDMVGNVREWTLTLWGERRSEPDTRYAYPYQDDARNDPNANEMVRRVFRGGAGKSSAEMTCTARGGFAPNQTGPIGNRHGFRVVLLPDE